MTDPGNDAWLDGDAGRLVRPYAVTNGRTKPSLKLDLMSMVVATGTGVTSVLEPDHIYVLGLCERPSSVAEIAARIRLPAVVAKVLLSDLADCGAVRTAAPQTSTGASDRNLLEKLLDGLQRRL
jgi:Protein of unknown function (DUF742)